jgi:hypothetical protein
MIARRALAGLLAGWLGLSTAQSVAIAGQSPGIGAHERAVLRADARRAATIEGDPHPYDIQAVRTTIAGAERATGCHCQSFAPPESTPIYLVAMRGNFSCSLCSPPPRDRVRSKSITVMTLEIAIVKYGSGPTSHGQSYPKLRLAGVPVRLSPPAGTR